MRTLIVSINSQYIHSNLAVWYLKASCSAVGIDTKVMEFSINQTTENVYSEIMKQSPEVLCFSVYIWNVEFIKKLCDDIKKVSPRTVIILGGPEVTYNSAEILEQNSCIDFCICGAGERSLAELLQRIELGKSVNDIDGVSYVCNGEIVSRGISKVSFCDTVSPYTEEMLSFCSGKIFYYESSRGCPFGCSYCLSSCDDGVMYLSVSRVFEELTAIVKAGYKLIKFVDRTFNANAKRSYEIVEFIINNTGDATFHFEIGADLLTDELIKLLATAPPGKIQLEAGIQSTNEKTLEAINRKADLVNLFKRVRQLVNVGNIHMHVDLIAGLPFEDYRSFSQSFNEVYSLGSHELQLGFLKLLYGTKIRIDADENGYLFRDYSPYEFLQSSWLTFDEVIKLKGIERVFELFGNGGRFCFTLEFLQKRFGSAFEMFEHIASCLNLNDRPFSLVNRYRLLVWYIEENFDEEMLEICKQLMRFDFRHSCIRNEMPTEIKVNGYDYVKLKQRFELSDTRVRMGDISRGSGIYVEEFRFNPVTFEREVVNFVFDYGTKSFVSGLCEFYEF